MEKRRVPRIMVKVVIVSIDDEDIRLLLDYPDSEAYLYDYSTNLSEGGIFLKITEPIPIGKQVSIKFTIPNNINLLEVTGIIRWFVSVEEAQLSNISPGVGIEFCNMSQETKQVIKNFIDEIK